MTYILILQAYHPCMKETNNMHLARYVGSPEDDDAPLWVRRLPPRRFLRFPQPLDFIGKLVGGMTDISVESLLVSRCCGLYIYI